MSDTLRAEFPWRNSPLFQACDSADWNNLSGLLKPGETAAGDLLWREGELDAGGLYLCRHGQLELFRRTPGWGKPIILAQFSAGSVLGGLPPLAGELHSTTLRAVVDSFWLVLETVAAEEFIRTFPDTASRLRQGLFAQERLRLRALNQRLTTLF